MLAPLFVLTLAASLPDLGAGNLELPPADPQSTSDVEAALLAVNSADAGVRASAFAKLAALAPTHRAALAVALYRPRGTPATVLRTVVLETGAQVPNWVSSDPLWVQKPIPKWVPSFRGEKRPRRPPPPNPETLDWLLALNELDLSRPDLAALDPAVRTLARLDAVEIVALLRALGKSGSAEAVAPLFSFAFVPEGVFRDECGRQIRALGDIAVAELIVRKERSPLAKQKRYAAYQLDRMDRAQPLRAINATTDDRVRAAMLHAYGEVRAIDAVDAVLSQVDAASARVRREARWAWLRYVVGKPPPPAPRRKRKLPGGHTESEEKPDYLTYRELAELALAKRFTAVVGTAPDAKRTPAENTETLFARLDEPRNAGFAESWQRAEQHWQAKEYALALADYQRILVAEPSFSHRPEIAAHLVELAGERGKTDEPAALELYRQAADLVEGERRQKIEAQIALHEGLLAERRGTADPSLFSRALALDPSLGEARAASARHQRGVPRVAWTSALVVAVAALGLGLVVVGLVRRRRAA